jgi:hypothetical protein
MRRSALLIVVVHCPHFKRIVAVSLNEAIGRLVYCSDGDSCRKASTPSAGRDADNRPYPAGCPVYPSLTAQA